MDLDCSCTTFHPVNIVSRKCPEQPKHERRAPQQIQEEERARRKSDENSDRTQLVVRVTHSATRKLDNTPYILISGSTWKCHVEGQLTKTRVSEPPAGRFPKFLLPWAAGRPQDVKPTKSILSPMLVRVVGREKCAVLPGGTKIFRNPHIGLAGRAVPIGG